MSSLVVAESTELTAIDEEQLVTMMVDQQLFGIPILKVQDIVEPDQITPVPLAPAAIAGVLNLRGRIVTVIDLRELLGAPSVEQARQMSVTVEHKGDLYTLLVDSIGDVRSLPKRGFEKPPVTLDENMRRLSSGIFGLEETLLVVLDVDRILDEETIMKTPKRTRRRVKKVKASPSDSANDDEPPAVKSTKKEAGSTDEQAPKKASAKAEKPMEKAGAAAADQPSAEPTPSSASKTNLIDLLGGSSKATGLIDEVFKKLIVDPSVSHFADGEDAHAVNEGFKNYALAALGDKSAGSVEDLKVILDLLVREQGLDDDHFITVARHANDVLGAKRVDVAATHAVLEIIDALRNEVIKR